MSTFLLDPNKYRPMASLLVLPELQVRELVKKFLWQFRDDRCALTDLTGLDCQKLHEDWYTHSKPVFSRGGVQFYFQFLEARIPLDKANRVCFYLIGNPVEVSRRLSIALEVPERLREEQVMFIFHIQYAI